MNRSPFDRVPPDGDLRAERAVEDAVIVGWRYPRRRAFLPVMLKWRKLPHHTDRLARIERARAQVESNTRLRAGAVENTLFCLVMSQDDAGEKYPAGPATCWPGGSDRRRRTSERTDAQRHGTRGLYIPSMVWNEFTNHNLVTGHPLAAAPWRDLHGVVNHKGQVYDTTTDTSVHRDRALWMVRSPPSPVSIRR